METQESARQIALSLPEVVERDHHGMLSYRVGTKILATVPDDDHLRIMLDEPQILAAVAENPTSCEPFHWGSKLACVVVDLREVPRERLEELLTDAWLRKAPKRLAAELRAGDDRAS